MLRLVTSVAIAATLAASAAKAQAPAVELGTETRSATVRVADLNLSTASGLATFRDRVRFAANEVCGVTAGGALQEAEQVARCHGQVRRSAERGLGLTLAARQDNGAVGTR
jgi:UrcA family protein